MKCEWKIMPVIIVMMMSSQGEGATALDVGVGNYISGTGVAAIGQSITIISDNSVMIGEFILSDGPVNSLGVGQYHNLGSGGGFFVAGSYNSVYGNDSITAGHLNVNYSLRSLVVGCGHMAVGSWEDNKYNDAMIAGTYSAEVSKPAFLVIGNGSSGAGNRKNAFVVHQDGDVIVTKRQGDVSMGIYGN